MQCHLFSFAPSEMEWSSFAQMVVVEVVVVDFFLCVVDFSSFSKAFLVSSPTSTLTAAGLGGAVSVCIIFVASLRRKSFIFNFGKWTS